MTALLQLMLSLALVQEVTAASATQARPGTGQIRGRITDKESGLPLPRAVVSLRQVGNTTPFVTRADDAGRYQFVELASGEYDGYVEAGAFRGTHLMASLRDAVAPPRSIVLRDGEVRDNVNVALQRALAMTVRVVDEWGEPLSGLRIRLTLADTGRTVFSSPQRATNDRGRLRLFKLQPGRYIVCTDMMGIGLAGSADSSRRERFLSTCYPSAASAAQAEPVRLERADIDELVITMRRGRTFTISGMVLDSSGGPVSGARVSLGQFERNASSSTSIGVGADGRFTMSNVLPGDYAIEATIGGPEQPGQRRALEAGFQPVRIESSDVDDVVVTMATAVQVAGRISLEDPAVPFPRPPGSGLLIRARIAGDRLPGTGSARFAIAGEDRVFTLDRLFGRRTLELLNVPNGWYVKAIRYEGKDVIDVPTEFKASTDSSALDVILSTRGAVVAGRALDDRGETVRGARVVMFPADPTRWGRYELSNVMVSGTGAFRVGPKRGGDYLIVAVAPSVPIPQPGDHDRLARLAESAERITLGDGEELSRDLRVVMPR